MAFEVDVTAGKVSFSIVAKSGLVGLFWGRMDEGALLWASANDHDVPEGVRFGTWRNPLCNTLNVVIFGQLFLWNSGRRKQATCQA